MVMTRENASSIQGVTESSKESTMLNEQERTIYKTFIKYSKKFHYEHLGVIDTLGIWKQRNNETAKMVAVVSMNRRAKQIVLGIYEMPYNKYEKNKLDLIEYTLHRTAQMKLFLTYAAFKRVAWMICEKVDEDTLDLLIKECEEEAN